MTLLVGLVACRASTPQPSNTSGSPTEVDAAGRTSPAAPSRAPASRAIAEPLERGAAIDPTYLELAEATGGWVKQDMRQASGVTGRLAAFVGSVPGALRIPLVVDSTVSALSITSRGPEAMVVRLYDPRGGLLDLPQTRPGRADYRVRELPRGTWQLEVTQTHEAPIDVEVQCESSLSARVELKRPGGRSGHLGWFPLVGRPTFGRKYLVEVKLREAEQRPTVSELRVGMVTPGGDTRWLETSKGPETRGRWLAEASFRPDERMVISGTLTGGEPFRRLASSPHPSPFLVESVEPGGARLLDEVLVPSRERAVAFRVQRNGSSGPALLQLNGSNIEARVEPSTLALSDGQFREVTLYLKAPELAPAQPSAATLTLSVGSEASDPNANAIALTAQVARDGDGDGFSDHTELAGGPNYDGDGDEKPDFEQPEVASFAAGGAQFSLRFEPSATLAVFERAVVLGKDLPKGLRYAPDGSWRLGVAAGGPEPKKLTIYLGRGGLSSLALLSSLLVFDRATARWQLRASRDQRRNVFELQLNDAERAQLRAGTLRVAVAQ